MTAEITKTIEAEMAMALKGVPFQTNTSRSTTDLLTERAKTHGDYNDHAKATQDIKRVYRAWDYGRFNEAQMESLDMIAHKIGRILAGDPDFRDHWDDIAGYAKLVADRCSK